MSDVSTTRRKAMPPSRRLRIFEAHKGICVLCNGKIDGVRQPWIVEHLRALGLGGPDTDDNCGPAHAACADAKTHLDDIPAIAKAKRRKARHLGIRKPSSFRKPSGGHFEAGPMGFATSGTTHDEPALLPPPPEARQPLRLHLRLVLPG